MEDQQPEPGDVSEESPDTDADNTPEAGDTAADEPEAPDTPAAAGRPRRIADRLVGVGVGVGVAVVLVVAASAFTGAALQPYLADRALVATKLDIARAATNAITALWTYTPENIDTLPDRAAGFLTGDFAARYRKDIERIAPQNKQAEVSVSTEVVGVAVSSVNGPDASALVYTNTTSTSPQNKDIPGLQYRSYQVSMTRDGGAWRATELANITRFSLTPQF